MNELTTTSDNDLMAVMQNSIYPGAAQTSIIMALTYCKAAGLDPIQKPVHIVPVWDRNSGKMRDVIMPGIGLYRTQAARSGNYAGISDPEFGPDVTESIGGQEITYPAWCRVTVKRAMPNGQVADFTATERWKENYAVRGGKEKSIAPNAMWARRPYGQLAKCAEAQALRKAFPEIGSQPTAEEMDGKAFEQEYIDHGTGEVVAKGVQMPQARKPEPDAEAQEPADQNAGAVDSAPAAPAASAPVNDTLATIGERAYITKKLANLDPPRTPAEACEACKIDNWDRLTKDGFEAIKAYTLSLG